MRQVYLAATGQNRGKTTTSIGLLDGFLRRGLDTRFMKPVGQRTVIEDGVPADEDAMLIRNVFGLTDPMTVMSPVHIPRGFTKAYINGEIVEDLGARIRAAPTPRSARSGEILLIEGTGHAGVGAVIGLSNATVAAMLGAPGDHRLARAASGRPIDEIVLERVALRQPRRPGRRRDRQQGRPRRPAGDRPDPRAGPGPPRHPAPGRPALPADPVEPDPGDDPRGRPRRDGPSRPGPRPGDRRGGDRRDGAAPTCSSGSNPDTLVIVPGDREDVILTLTTAHIAGRLDPGGSPARGGARPRPDRRLPPAPGGPRRDPRADLFATIVAEDTYVVASEVHDLLVKTHSADTGKIEMIKALVWEHLKMDRVLDTAGPVPG